MQRRESHIFERENLDHYVEPHWVSTRLFEVEEFESTIYDPAVGWGRITDSAQAAGYMALGSDLIDRKRHKLDGSFCKRDFLTWRGPISKQTSVVCNPPFDQVEEFCRQALKRGASRVAMLMMVRRLNAARWLQSLPLQTVYLLTPRPSVPPGAWIAEGNKPGGGTQDFCWLVFDQDCRSAAALRWLHRDG